MTRSTSAWVGLGERIRCWKMRELKIALDCHLTIRADVMTLADPCLRAMYAELRAELSSCGARQSLLEVWRLRHAQRVFARCVYHAVRCRSAQARSLDGQSDRPTGRAC